MEEKFMKLAREKFKAARDESEIVERDKNYDQVDICRQFARFGQNYGERALRQFFNEIAECVKEEN